MLVTTILKPWGVEIYDADAGAKLNMDNSAEVWTWPCFSDWTQRKLRNPMIFHGIPNMCASRISNKNMHLAPASRAMVASMVAWQDHFSSRTCTCITCTPGPGNATWARASGSVESCWVSGKREQVRSRLRKISRLPTYSRTEKKAWTRLTTRFARLMGCLHLELMELRNPHSPGCWDQHSQLGSWSIKPFPSATGCRVAARRPMQDAPTTSYDILRLLQPLTADYSD